MTPQPSNPRRKFPTYCITQSRAWTRRWFGLSPSGFYYYRSSRERQPSCIYHISSLKHVRRRGELDFEVHFGETKTFLLRAESSHDLQHWMDAFEGVASAAAAKSMRSDSHDVGEDGTGRSSVPLEDFADMASPSKQVLQKIHEAKRERHLQSSPTSPLQLGPGSETSDSRPESAVSGPTDLTMPPAMLKDEGDGTWTRGDEGHNDGETREKVSPRALLANPSKAFGGFFAPTSGQGSPEAPNSEGRASFYSEETSVLSFENKELARESSYGARDVPTQRMCAAGTASASKKSDDDFTRSGADKAQLLVTDCADTNWIDEDFDADSEDESAGQGKSPAAHISHARRSLNLGQTSSMSSPSQPPQPPTSAYGAVIPDNNWVDEDWDSDTD